MSMTPSDPGLLEVDRAGPAYAGAAFSTPWWRLGLMATFLAAVGAGVGLAHEALIAAFTANTVFNGVIAGVFTLAVAFAFVRVVKIARAAGWLRSAAESLAPGGRRAPRALVPLARLIGEKGEGRWPTRDVEARLDATAARFGDDRDASRYLTGLLVFLGLLGTFWGLLLTITAVADAFQTLDFEGGAADAAVVQLIEGLRRPIGGMSTAFSSSLFGLGGSLVAGFLDLQANTAQSRLIAEAEDWARGRAAERDMGEAPVAYLSALVETLADRVEGIEAVMDRFDRRAGRAAEVERQALEGLSEAIRAMRRPEDAGAMSEVVARLRAIEGALDNIRRDAAEGREETLKALRADIKLAARAVSGGSQAS